MRHLMPYLLGCLAAVALAPAFAAPPKDAVGIALEAFLKNDQFRQMEISPDGEHYAATVPLDDRTALVILKRSDLSRANQVLPEAEQHVTSVDWVNPKEVVFTISLQAGALAAPMSTGYLYAVDTARGPARRLGREYIRLLDPLRDDDRHILVSHSSGSARDPVSRLDLETSKIEVEYMKQTTMRGATYLVDNAGEIRFAMGHVGYEIRPTLQQRGEDGTWEEIHSQDDGEHPMYLSGFSADNRTAYFIVEEESGPDGFYAYDMATRKRRLLSRHERVDVGRELYSPLTGALIALEYWDGPPTLKVIEPDDPFVGELQKVVRAFPGAYVSPTSYTRDGKVGIYLVSSDVNSGDFYRVDHNTGQATYLASRNLALDPERLAPMRSFRFKARDGLELHGLVTVPRAAAGRPAPLVVIPHGGPKGVFDNWGFDREVQMLASQGYAVLQVNFRGSGNRGRDFRESGNGEWGARMQDDVTDATQWALREGIAAPGRICLYGASYGAYSAMMGLVREPALYACGIGNLGVYDLARMYRSERRFRDNKDYFDQALGDVDLDAISPVRLASRIRVPVLLGAGELDYTAPVGQTRSMNAALELAGVPVEMAVYPREAHGYYKYENRLDWATRVLAHLDKTIGAGAKPAPAAP
ncbi:MAG TPA: prolyl oligopeptidase family serine peptidase [Arenimonas sp.]|nr:prolyl oligopeptidase family serine peptidase [Arenimonas sp.]